MSEIKFVTVKEALEIIENRLPLGLFISKTDNVAIDNDFGYAWTEEFENVAQCEEWLMNP